MADQDSMVAQVAEITGADASAAQAALAVSKKGLWLSDVATALDDYAHMKPKYH